MKYFKFKHVLLMLFIFLGLTQISSADLSEGLVAYYPFNGNVNDESGNGKDGTVTGASLTSDKNGISDSAYNFDGIDDRITAPTIFEKDQDPLSFTAWLLIDNEAEYVSGPIFIECGQISGAHRNSIWINTKTNRISFDQFYPAGGAATLEIDLNKFRGKWFHFALTKNDDLVSFYINSEQMATVEHTETFSGNIPQITSFGALLNDLGWGNFFKGKIDEIRIYNRSLTEEDIQELYSLYVNEIDCAEIVQNSIAELSQKFSSLSETYSELSSNYQLLSSSFLQNQNENIDLNSEIKDLEQRISNMYTQEQFNNAIGQKELIISQLNSTIASMFTQSQLDQAINEEKKGLYTSESVNLMINKLLEWDVNNDGTIGILEAIQALKISTGIQPIE